MSDDGLIRDIPRIRRYSRHNEAKDLRFAADVKMSSMSNAAIDEVVRQTTDEVWAKIDCLACGNCCKTLKIVVDAADIKRLARRTGESVSRFERAYIETSRQDGVKLLKSTPCVFLAADNKCTVYEDRPQACRDFPYLHDKNFRSRTLTMLENTATCPIVFNVWQLLKDRFWTRKSRPKS